MPVVEVTLRLELQYPLREIGKTELKAHIEDWVVSGGGTRRPDDPLFDGIKDCKCGPVREVK